MKIVNTVWKGNKNGAGFMKISKELCDSFILGEKLKVEFTSLNSIFYPIVSNYKNYLGFYIPQSVCINNNLLGNVIEAKIEKIDGFTSKIGNDGKIYIPHIEIDKTKLKTNDLVLIEGIIDEKKVERICEIHSREKYGKKEYFCIFSGKYRNKECIFKIKKKLKKSQIVPNDFIKNYNYGVVDKEKVAIFYTNKRLLIINSSFLNIEELCYYLGCYFSDGTKKGNSWTITASTFDQASFYINMHKKMILNPKITNYISITSKIPVDKDALKKMWRERCNIDINKIRERFSDKKSLKTNEYGSLVILETSQAALKFYSILLNYFIKKIEKERNRKMAFEFILGVLEGDGSPSANSRGHIVISTNKNDAKVLEGILKVTDLKYKIMEEISKKASIRITSLSILKNIDYLNDKLFKYYPKRRKKFIERFSRVGAVRFILGHQDYCSGWVKAWLKNEGILNVKYQLTSKGLKIKNDLENMIKDVP